MKGKPRVKLPTSARAGEVIEIRALVRHPMERGHREDAQGKTIARDIIHTFKVTLDDVPVFHAEFGTGVAANPFLSFYVTATKPGRLKLTWIDDSGRVIEAERMLNLVA